MGKALELGACLYTLIGATVVVWGIWRAWVKPKDPGVVDLTERRQPSGWSVRGELARLFLITDTPPDMSSTGAEPTAEKAGDSQVPHLVPGPVLVSATPNTDDTAPVP